ncbi:MAG: hypothetical protein ACKOC5_16180 [Chloroflexota bacterium]
MMAVAAQGPVLDSMLGMLGQLRHEHLAELVVISNSAAALELAQSAIPLPAGVPEWLTPLVSIAPAQLFSLHLTQAKGYNTEAPRNIHKVTETR